MTRMAAWVLLSVLPGFMSCSPGCEYTSGVERTGEASKHSLLTMLKESGLSTASNMLLSATPELLTIELHGGQIDGTDGTTYKYGKSLALLSPSGVDARFSQDDGIVETNLEFETVSLFVDVGVLSQGAMRSLCKDVKLVVEGLVLNTMLDPLTEQNGVGFMVADAEVEVGRISIDPPLGCDLGDLDEAASLLGRVVTNACRVGLQDLPPKVAESAARAFGLSSVAYGGLNLDFTFPPPGRDGLSLGVVFDDTEVVVTSQGLELDAATWISGRENVSERASRPLFPDLDPDGDQYDYAVAIKVSEIDRVMEAAFRLGFMDADIYSTSVVNGPTIKDIDRFLPGISAFSDEAPLLLKVKATKVPTVEFTEGTMFLLFKDLLVNLYFSIDSAWIRLVGGTVDARLDVDVYQAESGPVAIMTLGSFDVSSISFSELFRNDARDHDPAGALKYVANRISSRRLEWTLDFGPGKGIVFKSMEIRGSDEPFLFIYFDLVSQ